MVDECGRYKKYVASIKIPSSTNSGGARALFLLPCFVKCFGQNYNCLVHVSDCSYMSERTSGITPKVIDGLDSGQCRMEV